MKPEYKPQYQVKKTDEFISDLQELKTRYSRVTELNNAIEWALARQPHRFTNLTGDFYFWITSELVNRDFPKVKILYRILEDISTVILLKIEESID